MTSEVNLSLLWPNAAIKEEYKEISRIADRTITDLGIDSIVEGISMNSKYYGDAKRILLQLCDDEETIQYRLDILEDFINNPEFTARLEDVLPQIQKLKSFNDKKSMIGAEPLRKIAWQLEILSLYVDVVTDLKNILDQFKTSIDSNGLKRLQGFLEQIADGEAYQSMVTEIPQLREQLQSMSSITLGINLDPEFKPVEAIFLAAESKSVKKKRSFISSILGLGSADEEYQGVSQYKSILNINSAALETALFRCLEEVFRETLKPIGEALQKYIHLNTRSITELEFEIAFMIGAARFANRLSSNGLALCKPEVASKEERICEIESLTDTWFAYKFVRELAEVDLDRIIVGNDVYFGPDARVFILTGPNQGGKTTYTRSIGLAQVLFQAGIFVPGQTARISPVDWIFTHFSEEETPNTDNGRLGEESKKLAEIFEKATDASLLLLNESLSSTSPRDSYYLARELVKGMKLIGCRTVFATHILELAANVAELNQEVPGDDQIISMVAGIEESETDDVALRRDAVKRTYKVVPGPPRGMSFAKDIAQKYGLSFEQIVDTLRDRQVVGSNIGE